MSEKVKCKKCSQLMCDNRSGLCKECRKIKCVKCGRVVHLRAVISTQCGQCEWNEQDRKGKKI